MAKTKVFISYGSGNIESTDIIEIDNEQTCIDVENALKAAGFDVLRDKSILRELDSVSNFMKEIGKGDFVIPIISKKYLAQSEYCQIEIGNIVSNGKLEKNVFPIFTKYAPDITNDLIKNQTIKEATRFIDSFIKGNAYNENEIREFELWKNSIVTFINFLKDHIFFKRENIAGLIERIKQEEKKYLAELSEIFLDNSKFSIFDYVAKLDEFGFEMPLSLIQKIRKDEFSMMKYEIQSNPNNNIGIVILGSIHNGFILKLNEYGRTKREHLLMKDDNLLFNILTNCDLKNELEAKLFNQLTLKQKYFNSLFKKFSIDFGLVIDSDHYLTSDKLTLYYRILGLHYFDTGDIKLMRKSFEKCIDNNTKDSASFLLTWAILEIKLNNIEKACFLLKKIIENFPERTNKSAKVYLSIIYYKDNKGSDIISLFKDNDFELIKNKAFWEFLKKRIGYLISDGLSNEATVAQLVFIDLAHYLKRNHNFSLSTFILSQLDRIVGNNSQIKIDLIKSYFTSDPPKALKLLNELKTNDIYKSSLVGLYIDYYTSQNLYEAAIRYGENFIKQNSESHLNLIYSKLGNIFYIKDNWEKAKYYFEKINGGEDSTNFKYAIALMNLSNKEHAHRVFQNYFKEFPDSTDKDAISNYVKLCLITNNKNQAEKLILEKINVCRIKEYSDYFISFLYQQQLRLTTNYDLIDNILKSALDFAENSNQKAIVLSNYAKYLMFNNETDTFEAIKLFQESNELKKDPIIDLDIAKCYYYVYYFEKCLNSLEKITDLSLLEQVKFWKINVYRQLEEPDRIVELIPDLLEKRTKAFAYLCLAELSVESDEIREKYFLESIMYDSKDDVKFKYAVFLYSRNKISESEKIINDLKSGKTESEKIRIQRDYYFQISIFHIPITNKTVIQLEKSILNLSNSNAQLLFKINDLIRQFPLEDRFQVFKFNYYFKLKKYSQCERVLVKLIDNNRMNRITSILFYKISQIYFEYSTDKNIDLNIPVVEQIKYLILAAKYIEYAIKGERKNSIYIELYSLISYKQGNFKKSNAIIQQFTKVLDKDLKTKIELSLEKEKNEVQRFFWPEILSEYFVKIQFYNMQEKNAAAILGDKNNLHKNIAIAILKSIESDIVFHRRNNKYLLSSIKTRLGYYYFINNDIEKAFYYDNQVYKFKVYDDSFIGAYLKIISKLKKNKIGIEFCEFVLLKNPNANIFRYYGNFLKEIKEYKRSYDSYLESIRLATEDKFKGLLYHNIALLCITALEEHNYFESKENLLEIGQESIDKTLSLYPTFMYVNNTISRFNDYISNN